MMNIEIEIYDGRAHITNNSRVAMYAGDRGTEVWATVELARDELKGHIAELCRAWREMGPKEG